MWDHSFLIEKGFWKIEGSWLEKNQMPVPVTGVIIINWRELRWFNMETRIDFPENFNKEIYYQCRGHFQPEKHQYNYLAKENSLGSIEGEGWFTPVSVIQRFWVISDLTKRTGFESFFRIDQNTYRISSTIFTGHYLTSILEGVIERQV